VGRRQEQFQVADDSTLGAIQHEIIGLFENIQKIKSELASIHHPEREPNLLDTVADQLNAIAEETTTATDEIMSATEEIQVINGKLLAEIKFGGAQPMFLEIEGNLNRVMNACSFHDITGQRISKIVNTINIVEGTLNSLVVILGKDGLSALPMQAKSVNRYDGDLELEGPQIGGPEFSQDDIDKLFD
jgi:hypothetical protein